MAGRSNLDQLTVVVPTICRQAEAFRQALSWTKLGVKVIVVDGSEVPAGALVSRHDGVTLTYVHDVQSFRKRLVRAANHVDTPYVLCAADDDLFVPSAVSECIGFLNTNPAYGTCKGQALTFKCRGGRVSATASYLSLQGYRICADTSSQRVSQVKDFRAAAVYAVQRTEIFRAAVYAIGASHDFENHATASLPEMLWEITAASASGIYCIDRLMWLRNGINAPMWKPEQRIRPREWWQGASRQEKRHFVAAALDGLQRSRVESCEEADLYALMDAYSETAWEANKIFAERASASIQTNFLGLLRRLLGGLLRLMGLKSFAYFGTIEALRSQSLLPLLEFREASKAIKATWPSRSKG